MAGLGPMPGGVSYAATKHAVVGLSTSLRVEAAIKGIRVSVLCPGIVKTAILEGGKFGKDLGNYHAAAQRMYEKLQPMSSSVFAEKALKAIAKNKPIIIKPSFWKIIWWTSRLSPSLRSYLSYKFYQDMLKGINE